MASGLLTEQEPREGENTAISFEPHALFTPSAIRGGAYLALRYGLGVFVSLGNMLVMTRWIGPHPYGLFVTAIGIVAFLSKDRKSTRLNSSHTVISYAVFCLKKKTI